MQWSSITTKARCYPPKGFKSAVGLHQAYMVDEPQFAQIHGNIKGSRRKGLLYQDLVTDRLSKEIEGIAGPWFWFSTVSGLERFAQPDWIGFDFVKGRLFLVEIKLTRVPDAWWQLNKLYEPIVKKVFPCWDVVKVEVSRKAHNVLVPEEVRVVQKLSEARPGMTSFLEMPYNE